MTDVYEPPLEAAGNAIETETEEESPLIRAVRDFVESFRDKIFPKGAGQANGRAETEPGSDEQSDEQLLDSLLRKYGIVIKPQELIELRQAGDHVGLSGNAGIREFVESDFNVLFDLAKIHEVAESRMAGLDKEGDRKRWQMEVENSISRTLASYATRYGIRRENPEARLESRVKIYLGDFDNVEGVKEPPVIPDMPVAPDMNEAKVIDIAAKRQAHSRSEEGPDGDEPEPIQPKTNVA
jgi:hypothetical protein